MPEPTAIVRSRRARRLDQHRRRATRLRAGGIGIGIIISLVLAALIMLVALAYANLTSGLRNVAVLTKLLNPPDGTLLQPTRIYDRTGKHLLLSFVPTGAGDGARRYIPINPKSPQHLPDFLVKATVAAADPNFWSQNGYLLNGWNEPEVHPTIPQKLVSDLLLYDETPSLRRALRERILAAQSIAMYGRSQILEWYLNSADYGNRVFGVDAAAQLYYGKPAADLTPSESAVLAATSQAPSLNPFDAPAVALQRGQATIQRMQSLGFISKAAASQALSETSSSLSPPSSIVKAINAPAFINLVLQQLDQEFTRDRIERGGLTIVTTLDYDLQQQAVCATLTYAARLSGKADPPTPCPAAANLHLLPAVTVVEDPSASALVLDPQSGQVLAAAGETFQGRETPLLSTHNPGTLLSTFVYLTAFTRGFGPASLVWDVPTVDNVRTLGEIFHGPIRMRDALVNDYQMPVQTVADQMGADAINRTESSFGLVGNQATLLELAQAYGIFATQGVRFGQPAPSVVLRVEGLDHSIWFERDNPQAQPIVSPSLAYLINNILSDESARWPSLGHPNELEIGRPAAVKLGKSDNGQDAWTVGYSPQRVTAVWTGSHATGAPPLSPRLSAVLWNALMQATSQALPADGWPIPTGITSMQVCDPSGLLPTKDCPSIVNEIFLSGNEPAQPDDLYRTYEINHETGYLATVFTPPDLIEDKVFMIVPPEAQAWAKSVNIPSVPIAYDAIQAATPNPDVHITSPQLFANVAGKVQIKGTASGAAFDHYRIVVGQGLNPQRWILVGSDSSTPIVDGTLATWDTSGLSGLYAVQLQVVRTDHRMDTAVTQVTIISK